MREHPLSHLRGGRGPSQAARGGSLSLPENEDRLELRFGRARVRLTSLGKPFWPDLGLRKRDLLQYYADVAPVLVSHLRNRAMVMKRYPQGAYRSSFLMKRAPMPRPPWIQVCSIRYASGNVVEYPMVQDTPSLLWMVNLGCIDLHPWHSRCDDVDRPDFLHFDLDPVKGEELVPFERVREAALALRDTLSGLEMPSFAKTSGSRGIHVYVPIVRGPRQRQVGSLAKKIALDLDRQKPSLVTAEHRVSKRPPGRVLVDTYQNAWGRTLPSVYSVRPFSGAPVSAPVTWEEVERGFAIEDFSLKNLPERLRERGDLWAPLLERGDRARLERLERY